MTRPLTFVVLTIWWFNNNGIKTVDAAAPVERATSLVLNQELRREAILAPGYKLYTFTVDAYSSASAMELRVSHLSQPPAEFSFTVLPFPEDGSVIVERRRKLESAHAIRMMNKLRRTRLLQRRRRLNTAIHRLRLGINMGGVLLPDGSESKRVLIMVKVKPVGILPAGPETSVIVPFNIVIEKKLMDDLIPESAARMVSFGVICLLGAIFLLVPYLSYVLRLGDDLARLILLGETDEVTDNDERRRTR